MSASNISSSSSEPVTELSSNPDLDPAHEALLLKELFRELLRSPAVEKRGYDFKTRLAEVEQAVDAFQLSVSPVVEAKASDAYRRINEACAACHQAHRN